MPTEDDTFYIQNIENVNRLTSSVLFTGNLTAPLLAIGTYAGIFSVPLIFCAKIAVSIFCISIVQWMLVYILKQHRLSMYFCLLSMIYIISFMGSNGQVGVYVSYALVIFISCLYYDIRVTQLVTILSFAATLISLYFKGISSLQQGLTSYTPLFFTLRLGTGYAMEFFFCYLAAHSITKRYRFALNRAIERNDFLLKTHLDIMNFLPKILESHELFTGHHVRHTVSYVNLICRQLVKDGHYTDILTERMITTYSIAANLHDIGKLHIPDHILNKRGTYTPSEFKMMQSHPEEGRRLIDSLPLIDYGNFNEIASQMALYHHEFWDGTGYPLGISGTDIPLCARIMAAADVIDALLSWRPYKQPYDIDKSIKIISEASGTQFEPCIAQAVIELKDTIKELSNKFRTTETLDEESEFEWRTQLLKEEFQGL